MSDKGRFFSNVEEMLGGKEDWTRENKPWKGEVAVVGDFGSASPISLFDVEVVSEGSTLGSLVVCSPSGDLLTASSVVTFEDDATGSVDSFPISF